MKILPYSAYSVRNKDNSSLTKNNKNETSQLSQETNQTSFAPGYLAITFGGIKNSSPKVLFENYKNDMPDTLRDELESYIQNIPERDKDKKTIAEINYNAFKKLADCHSIPEIRAAYPDERIFEDLIDFSDAELALNTRNEETQKFFDRFSELYLAADDAKLPIFKREVNPFLTRGGNKVFLEDDDLTTYLIKKIFLEARSQNNISKEFQADLNPELCEKAGIEPKTLDVPSVLYDKLGIKYSKEGKKIASREFRHSLLASMVNFEERYSDIYSKIEREKAYNRILNTLSQKLFEPEYGNDDTTSKINMIKIASPVDDTVLELPIGKNIGIDTNRLKKLVFGYSFFTTQMLGFGWVDYLLRRNLAFRAPSLDDHATVEFTHAITKQYPDLATEYNSFAQYICNYIEDNLSPENIEELECGVAHAQNKLAEWHQAHMTNSHKHLRKIINLFPISYYGEEEYGNLQEYLLTTWSPDEDKELFENLNTVGNYTTPYMMSRKLELQDSEDKAIFDFERQIHRAAHNYLLSEGFIQKVFGNTKGKLAGIYRDFFKQDTVVLPPTPSDPSEDISYIGDAGAEMSVVMESVINSSLPKSQKRHKCRDSYIQMLEKQLSNLIYCIQTRDFQNIDDRFKEFVFKLGDAIDSLDVLIKMQQGGREEIDNTIAMLDHLDNFGYNYAIGRTSDEFLRETYMGMDKCFKKNLNRIKYSKPQS